MGSGIIENKEQALPMHGSAKQNTQELAPLVTVVIFGHLNRSFYLLTCLLTYRVRTFVTRNKRITSALIVRSTGTNRLLVPSVKRSTVGSRAFPVAGPKTWNALPEDVTSSQSEYTFRRQLKTCLFKKSFPDIII